MSGKALHSLALYGTCDGCGAEEAVLIFDNGQVSEHHCPTCSKQKALYSAASDQMKLLVVQAARAWLSIWGKEAYLAEALREILHDSAWEAADAFSTSEGVQSTPLSNAAD